MLAIGWFRLIFLVVMSAIGVVSLAFIGVLVWGLRQPLEPRE